MQLPTTKKSMSVPIKQLKASSGEQTMGSPLTLNEVLTNTGQPVISLNFEINAWYLGLVSLLTVCILAE
jgi:hypothetical protein